MTCVSNGLSRSVLLKSDPDSGMALVKSKDGRTKWLPVSTDTASANSWEERVRSWASRLGLCPQFTPEHVKGVFDRTESTPLPTPPPTEAVGRDWSAMDDAAEKHDIPSRQVKRAGSFAKGFLLGLGGGNNPRRDGNPPAVRHKATKDAGWDLSPHKSEARSYAGHGRRENIEGSIHGRDRWIKSVKMGEHSTGSSSASSDIGPEVVISNNSQGDVSNERDKKDPEVDGKSTESKVLNAQHDPKLESPTESELVNNSKNLDEIMEWIEPGIATGGMSNSASKSCKKKKKGKPKGKSKAKQKLVASSQKDPSSSRGDSKPSSATRVLSETARPQRRVSYGAVALLEYTRDVGGCAVPSDGTWGMALGVPFRETCVEVDGYEASKAEILAERTQELTKKQKQLSTGETRQFDYRSVGTKNPLFSRLEEKERSERLLDYACFHKGDLDAAGGDSQLDHSHLHEPPGFERTQSSSTGEDSYKISHADFVDKSQAAAMELQDLRRSRRQSVGCDCACIRPDKLNVARLREELHKRKLKASGSKKELTKVLQEAMRQEEERDGEDGLKVCRGEDCQCVRDGVDCHADVCNCCKGPSSGRKDVQHGGLCGNPEGVYAYSSAAVDAYRAKLVTKQPAAVKERRHGRSDSMGV